MRCDMAKVIDLIKETGSHYTSDKLSTILAEKLLAEKLVEEVENSDVKSIVKVLDPACGDGELLLSIANSKGDLPFKFIGVDSNAEALEKAAERLKVAGHKNTSFLAEDYLELIELGDEVDLFNLDTKKEIQEPVDMIIANPPYVRTQVLGAEKAKRIGNKFNLKGRVDLYQAFLVAMTQQLKENGLICVITSNRYLTTAGGKDTRKFLSDNYDIIEVIDLGDTKLFSAAVLPAIFIGRKKAKNSSSNNEKVKFFRIYETTKEGSAVYCDSIYEILKVKESGLYQAGNKKYEVTVGFLKVPEDPKELWVMASKEDKEWAENIKRNAFNFFDDVFDVKVGIKSTADKVFIKKDWNQLDPSMKPEDQLLKPLISSEHTKRWFSPKDTEISKVLYPHEVIKGKRRAVDLGSFPKAKAYLDSNKEELQAREYLTKSKTRQWYELWVPQNPLQWKPLKVVFPDISSEAKFSIDTEGHIVDGNCYWLYLEDRDKEELLYLAAGVANSKLIDRFHAIEFQNVLYSSKKRYITQYVKNYPLPDPNSIHAKRIIELVKEIISINSEEKVILLEEQIEVEVQKAFGC